MHFTPSTEEQNPDADFLWFTQNSFSPACSQGSIVTDYTVIYLAESLAENSDDISGYIEDTFNSTLPMITLTVDGNSYSANKSYLEDKLNEAQEREWKNWKFNFREFLFQRFWRKSHHKDRSMLHAGLFERTKTLCIVSYFNLRHWNVSLSYVSEIHRTSEKISSDPCSVINTICPSGIFLMKHSGKRKNNANKKKPQSFGRGTCLEQPNRDENMQETEKSFFCKICRVGLCPERGWRCWNCTCDLSV